MKTQLPESIQTIEQAKQLLASLHENGESFHPEDDATQLAGDPFTKEEGEKLNQLMEDIYKLPGFDPCEYLLRLDAVFHIEGRKFVPLRDFTEKESLTIIRPRLKSIGISRLTKWDKRVFDHLVDETPGCKADIYVMDDTIHVIATDNELFQLTY